MKIEYEIDDAEIIEIAKGIAAERVADKLFSGRASYDRSVLVRAYKEICREIIYAHKEEIIDRVVIQATAEVKKKRIKCFLTGGCKFKSTDTQSKYNDKTKEITITETCYKCGKKYSFTAPSKNFGLDE